MDGVANAVVVVGSLHYDIIVDAPGLPARDETMVGLRWYPKFGGKGGNQAVAAARFGADTRMLGAVGGDAFAGFLVDQLRLAGVSVDFIGRDASAASGMSVAISDPAGDYAAVIVSGANLGIDPARLGDDRLWHRAAVLVLQNEVAPALNLAAARQAKARGVRVAWNAAPVRAEDADLAGLIDVLIVNTVEAEAMTGIAVAALAQAEAAAGVLAARFPLAVVTAGGAGVAVHQRDGQRFSLPALPVRVISTHGAGDRFCGVLAAALAGGADISDAVRLANAAAAAHVAAGV